MGINGIYYKLGKENAKRSMLGQGGFWKLRECASALLMLLKHTIAQGKGRTR
jgi:hypothetical protein